MRNFFRGISAADTLLYVAVGILVVCVFGAPCGCELGMPWGVTTEAPTVVGGAQVNTSESLMSSVMFGMIAGLCAVAAIGLLYKLAAMLARLIKQARGPNKKGLNDVSRTLDQENPDGCGMRDGAVEPDVPVRVRTIKGRYVRPIIDSGERGGMAE